MRRPMMFRPITHLPIPRLIYQMKGRCYTIKNEPKPEIPKFKANLPPDKNLKQQIKADLKKETITTEPSKVHLPTKEELLRSARNSLERLKVRFKWLLIRSYRPFNTDDFSAFFSWIVVGNLALFVFASTTFVSLVLYTINTVFAQEFVARMLGNFITKSTNLTVVFENAVVPSWRDGKISFRNCFVSRRPRGVIIFEKGSQAAAAAAAEKQAANNGETSQNEPIDDGNYTQFDLTIKEVNISLSFKKWVNGRGIIDEVEVKGMRGVVDRSHVYWKEGDSALNYKNVYQPGDWEIENFRMEDVLFTLKQPLGFRVFDVSIYSADIPLLRKNWLFYDLLNSNNVNGSYDGSLFAIHNLQKKDDFEGVVDNSPIPSTPNSSSISWRRVTRFRVDNLNLDHLNEGVEGPFGWIHSGSVDMIADVMSPEENQFNVSEVVQAIALSIKKEARRASKRDYKEEPDEETIKNDLTKYFVLDFQLKLNNPRASVPLFTEELSYVNNALIRPIVAYINSRNTFIPIKCRVVKKLSDFDGSWTIYDSLLMDDLQAEVYDAFVDYVADENARSERAKKVGFWSLQLFLHLILWSVGTIA